MTASTLLAALIAASSATNGVITVGDTQPFDQVRLYQNPANGTVLTNQSSDGSIDTSTTALVITGSTAPTGLVFTPNLSVLRNVTSDIKLLVDTPVELTLTVNLAGSLTEMTVEAGKTAVLTLGLIAGIPMIVGAFGFFPVASPSNPAETGLLLIATGANESLDGDYQRFAHDGVSAIEVAQGVFFSVWHAELESTARQAEYQVKVKMPVIDTASQEATVSFAAASITESGFFALSGVNTVGLGFLKYQSSVGCRLRVLQGTTVLSSVEITPTPIAGDEITLTLNADSVDYVHGANTGSLPVPNGFFSATPNVLAVSGNINPALIVPLSIKVAEG